MHAAPVLIFKISAFVCVSVVNLHEEGSQRESRRRTGEEEMTEP